MTPEEKAAAYTAAWNSKDAARVAGHFAPEASIVINRGDPHKGRTALEAMAAGFHAEFPDLHLTCDGIRAGGDHMIYLWTLEGHHAETGNHCKVGGWEEWDLGPDMQVLASKGWFDADDYQRQVDGG
ncbi:nuclear transport factor 2 family protein [uncultured Roseobacter sp.]|uniref:nuclear transport factor 2 family protein n=1 Tax=uncultured Roseobacter sp. TaxID=114847 RepID=UPI00260619FF|nr:nuclear transport factor 2 family protein [uncultured Roseobacter sp.]